MKADPWPNRDFFFHTWFNLWIFMWSLCAPLCSHFYVCPGRLRFGTHSLSGNFQRVSFARAPIFLTVYFYFVWIIKRKKRKERDWETINTMNETIHFMVEVAGEKKTGRWGNKYLTVKFFAIHENEIQYSERSKCWNL